MTAYLNNGEPDGGAPTSESENLNETFLDIFGYNSLKLKRKIGKRYAIGMDKFHSGVFYARNPDNVLGIVMTSMPGERNNHDKMLIDYRHLRTNLKVLGLKFEDCMCAEVSPDSHPYKKRDGTDGVTVGNLWHLHGIWRFNEYQKAGELHSILSPMWGKIHGSEIVNVKVITDLKKYLDYIVKDSIKGYCDEENWKRRLVISKGWLPPGFNEVLKILWKWAVWHGANWPSDSDFEYYNLGEYIPYVKEVKKDYFRRWCLGESLSLEMDHAMLFIAGPEILEMKQAE